MVRSGNKKAKTTHTIGTAASRKKRGSFFILATYDMINKADQKVIFLRPAKQPDTPPRSEFAPSGLSAHPVSPESPQIAFLRPSLTHGPIRTGVSKIE